MHYPLILYRDIWPKATGRGSTDEGLEESVELAWKDAASSHPRSLTIDPSLEYERGRNRSGAENG